MKPRGKEATKLLAEMLEAGLTVREVAEGLNLSYSYLAAVVYGRYDSERVMEMARQYVRGVRDGVGKSSADSGD